MRVELKIEREGKTINEVIADILEVALKKYEHKSNEGFNDFINKISMWNKIDDSASTYGELIYEVFTNIEQYGVLSLLTFIHLISAQKSKFNRRDINNIMTLLTIREKITEEQNSVTDTELH